ncbi:MAG: hypothetical protein JWN52_39 [Actinomycetia bacterium]|nr:hypothetical protein [Actinomycetes bacterium]
MKQRTTKLILAGMTTLSVGIGAASAISALPPNHPEVSLNNVTKAAAVTDLNAQEPAAAKLKTTQAKAAQPQVLLKNQTLGSYYWDTGSSGNGDTGAPASGLPMQEGCFASPSWPMGTRGYVEYNGKRADFFICDRGPGTPSQNGVMLDIDGITYAKLTGGKWANPNVVGGTGQSGHVPVTYYVTHWGDGPGKGAPQAL